MKKILGLAGFLLTIPFVSTLFIRPFNYYSISNTRDGFYFYRLFWQQYSIEKAYSIQLLITIAFIIGIIFIIYYLAKNKRQIIKSFLVLTPLFLGLLLFAIYFNRSNYPEISSCLEWYGPVYVGYLCLLFLQKRFLANYLFSAISIVISIVFLYILSTSLSSFLYNNPANQGFSLGSSFGITIIFIIVGALSLAPVLLSLFLWFRNKKK